MHTPLPANASNARVHAHAMAARRDHHCTCYAYICCEKRPSLHVLCLYMLYPGAHNKCMKLCRSEGCMQVCTVAANDERDSCALLALDQRRHVLDWPQPNVRPCSRPGKIHMSKFACQRLQACSSEMAAERQPLGCRLPAATCCELTIDFQDDIRVWG